MLWSFQSALHPGTCIVYTYRFYIMDKHGGAYYIYIKALFTAIHKIPPRPQSHHPPSLYNLHTPPPSPRLPPHHFATHTWSPHVNSCTTAHTYTRTLAYTCTQTPMHACTHACTHAHVYTVTCTHARMQAHNHTHTHTIYMYNCNIVINNRATSMLQSHRGTKWKHAPMRTRTHAYAHTYK